MESASFLQVSDRSSLEGGRASSASQEGGGHRQACAPGACHPPASFVPHSAVPLERGTDPLRAPASKRSSLSRVRPTLRGPLNRSSLKGGRASVRARRVLLIAEPTIRHASTVEVDHQGGGR